MIDHNLNVAGGKTHLYESKYVGGKTKKAGKRKASKAKRKGRKNKSKAKKSKAASKGKTPKKCKFCKQSKCKGFFCFL